MKTLILINLRKMSLLLILLVMLSIPASPSHAAEVLIIGNRGLKPVADVISGIQRAITARTTVISPADAQGNIAGIVRDKGASAVIALGTESMVSVQTLPGSVPVVYGLIIDPLEKGRKNMTGVYMSTPVTEYISFISKNFPAIRKLGIICPEGKKRRIEQQTQFPEVTLREAKDPYEFIDSLSTLGNEVDAVLLLPDKELITTRVLEEVYLFSFREKVPVIGISEKYVKIGSLFSLGFDTSEMGRQIGEITNRVLAEGSAAGIPQSPPDRLDFYVNKKTSEAMDVNISDKLLKTAKKVY